MKRNLAAFLSVILLFTLFAALPVAAAATKANMTVTLNGKALSFAAEPVIVNGRLLVPYRPIAEAIGATVDYDSASKTVTVTKESNTYLLPINGKTATVNGSQVALDTPAMLVNNRTLVPIRFVSESLGLEVNYDQEKRTVSLKTNAAPGFKIMSPLQGEMLQGDKVTVSVAVFNHMLADFKANPEPKAGHGHVHLWLDTDPNDPKVAYKLTKGAPVVFEHVQPGEHTLTVQLVGNDHKPIQPEVKQVVQFHTSANGTAAKTYHVDLASFAFKPNALTVEAGAKVIFTNQDQAEHTVTAADGSFDSGLFGKGETFEHTFSKPGVYKIYCQPHDRMVATITVN